MNDACMVTIQTVDDAVTVSTQCSKCYILKHLQQHVHMSVTYASEDGVLGSINITDTAIIVHA